MSESQNYSKAKNKDNIRGTNRGDLRIEINPEKMSDNCKNLIDMYL